MVNRFTKDYWENKYIENSTGWDIGYASTPIIEYCKTIENKDLKILIPGGGNSYEAEYLFKMGFKNVFVIDIAKQPLTNFKTRFSEFPSENLILDDFFNHSNTYDLIIEQTFFCALDPFLREKYVLRMNELLQNNGKLVGVLFNFPLTKEGPPFGGSFNEYETLFNPYFKIEKLEKCYNSIKPRLGNELFFIFEKNT